MEELVHLPTGKLCCNPTLQQTVYSFINDAWLDSYIVKNKKTTNLVKKINCNGSVYF